MLLLLLRCLVVVLLVLAFSRPVLNPDGLDGSFDSAARASVVVLDQTASMGISDGNRTRFEQARDAARKYVDSLGPGLRVAVFPVMSRNSGLASGFSGDLGSARRTIGGSELTAGTNDWVSVLRQSLEALAGFEGANREVVIFTDGQSVGWENSSEIQALLSAHPGVNVRLVTPGAGKLENAAVVQIKNESGIVTAGRPLSCLVEVANFGTEPLTDVRVTLAADRDPPADEKLIPKIDPGSSEVVRLGARFDAPGHHTLTAAIRGDRLPADDRRSIAVEVVGEVSLLLVGDSGAGTQRSAFFLENALAPVRPEERKSHPFKIHKTDTSRLEQIPLRSHAAIFLLNPSALPAGAASVLKDYVEQGGTLVIFPSIQLGSRALEPLADLLPARLAAPSESESTLHWQASGYLHPITSLWNSEPSGGLGSVSTTRKYQLEPTVEKREDQTAQSGVVLSHEDGSPAVMEKKTGRGTVVLFSTPLDTASAILIMKK